MGLKLNKSKCQSISAAGTSHLNKSFSGFKYVPVSKMRLLGAPVMPGEEVTKVLNEKTEDLRRAVSRLALLQAQDALTLVRYSLSIPKLTYILRTSYCHSNPAVEEFDNELRAGLSTILNVDVSGDQWQQASLPVRDGGLGIRSAVMLAPSAFLASAAGTTELQARILPPSISIIPDKSVELALVAWSALSQSSTPVGTNAFCQRNWDTPCIQHIKNKLLEQTTDQLVSCLFQLVCWLHSLHIPPTGCLHCHSLPSVFVCQMKRSASLSG